MTFAACATVSWPLALEHRAERLAFDEFHHEEGLALVFADEVDLDDVRVIERSHAARLAQEALLDPFIVGQGIGQHLDRDVAIQGRFVALVDHTHAAAAEFGDDVVMAQTRSHRSTPCRAPCPVYAKHADTGPMAGSRNALAARSVQGRGSERESVDIARRRTRPTLAPGCAGAGHAKVAGGAACAVPRLSARRMRPTLACARPVAPAGRIARCPFAAYVRPSASMSRASSRDGHEGHA